MVAIADSFREQWEKASEWRELTELEELARWHVALFGWGSQ